MSFMFFNETNKTLFIYEIQNTNLPLILCAYYIYIATNNETKILHVISILIYLKSSIKLVKLEGWATDCFETRYAAYIW